jgi:mono/diheme cytochrome c family protein
MAPRRLSTLALACIALLWARVAAAQNPDDAARGTYASDQAARGEKLFGQWCVECHARTDMSNPNFQIKWNGRTALELFDRISVAMPENYPGVMSPTEYLELVAYLLRLNGVPSGPAPLAGDSASLSRVRVGAPSTHQSGTHHLHLR